MSTAPSQERQAKELVLDFFDLAFVNRQPEQAVARYLGTNYTQHNPTAPDGPDIFPQLIEGLFAQAPQASFHLKRAVAEDDLVVLHYHLTMSPEDSGRPSSTSSGSRTAGSSSTGTSSSLSPPRPPTPTECSETPPTRSSKPTQHDTAPSRTSASPTRVAATLNQGERHEHR